MDVPQVYSYSWVAGLMPGEEGPWSTCRDDWMPFEQQLLEILKRDDSRKYIFTFLTLAEVL